VSERPGARPANGSIVETIVEKIKERVREGRYAPGQRLIESDIQQLFSVSRGPVREAVHRLASEGIIEIRHNSGATVRALSRADVCNVFQIREVLEGLAARMAAENIPNGADARALVDLEAQFKREFKGSALDYMRYNDRFHELIVRLSGNEQLIQMTHQLHLRVYRLQFEALQSSGSFLQSRREHDGILKAILNGDGARAETLMRQHVSRRLPQILADSANYFA
jgi:DNA-binding GntR family transcriptional regulator